MQKRRNSIDTPQEFRFFWINTLRPSDANMPCRWQAIIWTNAGILLTGPLGTNFSEISIEILTVLFTKMCLKGSSAKWRSFCVGFNRYMLVNMLTKPFTGYIWRVWYLLRTTCLAYSDIIMGAMASQITSITIVYSIVYSCAGQRKQHSSASLAFVRGIHRWPVNFPHKWPLTRKMFSIWWRHHAKNV